MASRFFRKLILFSVRNNLDVLFYWINNLRFILLRLNLTLNYVEINGVKGFKLTDHNLNLERYFIVKYQGYSSYHNGLQKRAEDLGEKSYLLHQIKFKKGDIVIDIGANLGDLNLYFQCQKAEIIYYGFEPGEHEYCCLEKNIEQKATNHIFQLALGDKNGSLVFYYKPDNGDSSIIPMQDYQKKINVEVKTYDTIIRDLNLSDKKIKLLKLEAEGFEPEIIKGAKEYLANIEYISADLGFERGVTQSTTSPEVINFLLKNEFKIIDQSRNRNIFLFKNLNFDS